VARVVIAHDYLTQRGGAERVVLAMLQAFPDARLVTSIYDPHGTFPEFRAYRIETLLPRAPLVRRDARLALPILAAAFGRHTVRDADVVVCSSSGWAHGVGSTAPKIVYCHTPARWLYQPDEYRLGHPWPVSLVLAAAGFTLRGWDARAAASAHTYIANSTAVAERVHQAYGRTAVVLHPPVTLEPDGPHRALAGVAPGFLLTVARGRGYKNADAVTKAARLHGVPLVVVGGRRTHMPGVVSVRDVDDACLRWLYENCRSLVAAAYEDFGLTPVEAMAFGKPVLALRAGGYLDTVVDGVSGLFFEMPTANAIGGAIAKLETTSFDREAIRRHSERFSLERFVAGIQAIVSDVLGESVDR
jgi:glycosyltransferase involved in cell wall biosynthesis